MYQVKRRGQITFEDLMRELAVIEQHLLTENSALAMNLMVLEAKLRERFQNLEKWGSMTFDDLDNDLTLADINALIPKDVGEPYASFEQAERKRRRKQAIQTVGMAAALAVLTALGVFGLASILQLTLSWLA